MWGQNSVDRLRILAANGKSAGQIARTLNEEFGLRTSRSAVCGKCFRLGIKLARTVEDLERKQQIRREKQRTYSRAHYERKKVAKNNPALAPKRWKPGRILAMTGWLGVR